ncbi:sensor domain-containing protein, partial [Agromyces sp. NPDC055657]
MLASESELNTILATTDLRPKTALRQPARLDADEHASRPVCLAVIGNAMDEVYRDSGFRQFRESLFADETNDLEVDQAVTAFDTPTAAKTLVTRTVDTWRQCAGDNLTISYGGNR